MKDITDYPPTTVQGDTAIWGPGTDPLSANTYRLTVTKVAPHVFTYKLDGKGKTEPDTAFVTVLSGTHTRALDAAGHVMKGFGSGDFTLDFDAADTLPQHDDNVGQVAFQYSRLSPTATVTIDVAFTGVQDHCDPLTCKTSGQIFDAVYAYSATPGSGGDLQYADAKNYDRDQQRQRDAVDSQPLAGDGRRAHRHAADRRRPGRDGRHVQRMLGLEFRFGLQLRVVRSRQRHGRLGRGSELRRVPGGRVRHSHGAVATTHPGPGRRMRSGRSFVMTQPVLQIVSGGKTGRFAGRAA